MSTPSIAATQSDRRFTQQTDLRSELIEQKIISEYGMAARKMLTALIHQEVLPNISYLTGLDLMTVALNAYCPDTAYSIPMLPTQKHGEHYVVELSRHATLFNHIYQVAQHEYGQETATQLAQAGRTTISFKFYAAYVETLQSTSRFFHAHPEYQETLAGIVVSNWYRELAPDQLQLGTLRRPSLNVGGWKDGLLHLRLDLDNSTLEIPVPKSSTVVIPGSGISNVLQLHKFAQLKDIQFLLIDSNPFIVHLTKKVVSAFSATNVQVLEGNFADVTLKNDISAALLGYVHAAGTENLNALQTKLALQMRPGSSVVAIHPAEQVNASVPNALALGELFATHFNVASFRALRITKPGLDGINLAELTTVQLLNLTGCPRERTSVALMHMIKS